MTTEEKLKVRSAAVTDTGRTSFRFDVPTWAAIDMIAERASMSWVDWAAKAIKARPLATSKAAAVRAALADALMAEQFKAMADEMLAGPMPLIEEHPILGTGYYRLDDKTLALELEGAEITLRDDSFEGFTLIVGYRDRANGGKGFVCVQNRLREGLHLFIAREEE